MNQKSGPLRYIWMFPRNKRNVFPLETCLILRILIVASNLGKEWGGNQEQQKKFTKMLEDYGLKREGKQRDKDPGGSRTYESQMSLLGLIYKRKDGQLELTQAGEDLVNFVSPTETLAFQVLKMQYPSAYSGSRNIGLDPSIKIRPFVFLLKLAADPEINGLSDKEMSIPVVFGKNDNCFEECKKLILRFRAEETESIFPDDYSIRTNKTQQNNFTERMQDIFDIANTFKCVLESAGLGEIRYVGNDKRFFPFTQSLERLPEIESIPFVDFLNLSKQQAAFQFGKRLGASKDTRKTFMPDKAPELLDKSGYIYQLFLKDVQLPFTPTELEEFVDKTVLKFGLLKQQVLDALEPILLNVDLYTGSELIRLSKGGTKTAYDFERIVEKIFRLEFGYEAHWTGRQDRPEKKIGGYMDVFVVEEARNYCGIIDAKSYKTYDLPNNQCVMGVKYIEITPELYGGRDLSLKFVAYVSHLITPEARFRAYEEIYLKKKIPVSLISASGLNSMRANPQFKGKAHAVTDHLSQDDVNVII